MKGYNHENVVFITLVAFCGINNDWLTMQRVVQVRLELLLIFQGREWALHFSDRLQTLSFSVFLPFLVVDMFFIDLEYCLQFICRYFCSPP